MPGHRWPKSNGKKCQDIDDPWEDIKISTQGYLPSRIFNIDWKANCVLLIGISNVFSIRSLPLNNFWRNPELKTLFFSKTFPCALKNLIQTDSWSYLRFAFPPMFILKVLCWTTYWYSKKTSLDSQDPACGPPCCRGIRSWAATVVCKPWQVANTIKKTSGQRMILSAREFFICIFSLLC